jgi:hypothetical protein
MITDGAKVLIPARHGLGDVLAAYFIDPRGRTLLARVSAGLATRRIVSALIVYEECYNPSTGELLRALPLDLLVRSTSDLPEIKEQDSDNRMPDAVRWHQNVYTNPPLFFESLEGHPWIPCPIRPPTFEVPSPFVLFSDGALAQDRLLTDFAIYDFLRNATELPIVKVGCGHDVVPADLNLSGKLSIVETLFLAKHATMIVSAVTMLRTAAALFGTPVLELMQQPSAETIRRTEREYSAGSYGITATLNRWFLWPADKRYIRETLLAFREFNHG